ncbi:MAG: hypothetical protein OQK82_08460, partial [Candidatus Pacearchaeota archaeon]|nr:hypothetical protein [Candidatus Pacearchaeota archaeon]
MIKQIWIFLSILPLFFLPLMAGTQTLAVVDELNASCSFKAEKQMLNNLLEQEAENKSEIYWRLSRATYRIGEAGMKSRDDKSKLRDMFKEGESYADKAIELDPLNAYAFYWKASNLGLWTQLKGPIDGLKNINPLRDLLLTALSYDPEYPHSYFFLGQMYLEVPG